MKTEEIKAEINLSPRVRAVSTAVPRGGQIPGAAAISSTGLHHGPGPTAGGVALTHHSPTSGPLFSAGATASPHLPSPSQPLSLCSPACCCMGAIRSQPEAVIVHLVKGCSQPYEHRWKQYVCGYTQSPSLLTSYKS